MWCQVCGPIRTAVRINSYKDTLEALPDLHLTTLTCANVQAPDIRNAVQIFRKHFRQFRNTWKKATGQVLRGVYNFECTFNPKTGTYHPHIHILHEGLPTESLTRYKHGEKEEYQVNALCKYWVEHNENTTIQAQDTRPCFDIIEGFKYQAKSVFKIKINGKKEPFVPVQELDTIFQALQGLRCFQPFGIEKAKEVDEETEMDNLTAYETEKPQGSYLWAVHDWYLTQLLDEETGELLDHSTDPNQAYVEIPLSEFVPNKNLQLNYENLTSNNHYSTYQRSKVPHQKGTGPAPGHKKQHKHKEPLPQLPGNGG